MRRTVLSTFLFVAILGLGCMGVAVPGQAEELKHPIELGKDCKALFQEYYDRSRSDTETDVADADLSAPPINFKFYNAFAYAYGATGKYACAYDASPRFALERCNFMSSHRPGSEVFERLKRPVVLASEQTPEYADIRLAGHDGGQFLLVRQDAITEQPSVSDGADALERAKKQCAIEFGFKKGTVQYGNCVMKLYK